MTSLIVAFAVFTAVVAIIGVARPLFAAVRSADTDSVTNVAAWIGLTAAGTAVALGAFGVHGHTLVSAVDVVPLVPEAPAVTPGEASGKVRPGDAGILPPTKPAQRETTEPDYVLPPTSTLHDTRTLDRCQHKNMPGECYTLAVRSEGTEPSEAARLYYRACVGRVAPACSRLGQLLEEGEAIPKDSAAALEFFRRACSAGYAPGCDALAELYADAAERLLREEHYSQERAKAVFDLLTQTCLAQNAKACVAVGKAYWHGLGVEVDPSQSAVFLESACKLERELATQGGKVHPHGCADLGLFYMRRFGPVPRDPKKAAASFEFACNFNIARACFRLSQLMSSREITGSPELAKELLGKACKLGYPHPDCRAIK